MLIRINTEIHLPPQATPSPHAPMTPPTTNPDGPFIAATTHARNDSGYARGPPPPAQEDQRNASPQPHGPADPMPEVYVPLAGAVAPVAAAGWERAGYRVRYFWRGRVPLLLEEGVGARWPAALAEEAFSRYVDFGGGDEACVPVLPAGEVERVWRGQWRGLFGANERRAPRPWSVWSGSRLDPKAREWVPPMKLWRELNGGDGGRVETWDSYGGMVGEGGAGGGYRDLGRGKARAGYGKGVGMWKGSCRRGRYFGRRDAKL